MFNELNNLTPEKLSKLRMIMLSVEYIKKILSKLSLTISLELKLFSPEYERLVNL
jgi:hypothetical protein